MRKYLTIIFSAILSIMIFSFAGCTDGEEKPTEINQWDYFEQYVNYTLYEYLDERPSDLSRNTIINSTGENQPNCWGFVGNFGDVNIKEMTSHSDLDYYFKLRISRKTSAKAITMTRLSLKIYAESDCEMKFSLSITGDATPRATITVAAVADAASELLFENFAEYVWTENSNASIIITLENPASIGNIKYGFSGLNLTLKNNA